MQQTCIHLYDKNSYVAHIRSLTQALNHGLILKKVHRVIQFSQEAWLEEYNDFEKDFFKLLNNSVFGNTMDNVRKQLRLVTTHKRRNQLVSELNCHTTIWFSENLLAIEVKKIKIKVKMNTPVYLGWLILDISKTLMYEFWYDHIKPKYQDNAKLCYMDTDSFIINIKTEDFYEDIAKKDLIPQIMESIDHYLKERIKK